MELTEQHTPRRPIAPASKEMADGLCKLRSAAMRGVLMVSLFHKTVFVATLVRGIDAYQEVCTKATSVPKGNPNFKAR